MILNIIFLVWGYSIALIPLFDVTRIPWERIKESHLDRHYYVRQALHILGSDRFKIVFHILFFGLGLYELVADRAQGQHRLAQDQSENEMTFGQILPLALMSLPIPAAMEVYYGTLCPIPNVLARIGWLMNPAEEMKRRSDQRQLDVELSTTHRSDSNMSIMAIPRPTASSGDTGSKVSRSLLPNATNTGGTETNGSNPWKVYANY
jgi:hypothetical protein